MHEIRNQCPSEAAIQTSIDNLDQLDPTPSNPDQMDFNRLPDNVFFKIFSYLPFKETIGCGRTSVCFQRMSKIFISTTKSLHMDYDMLNKIPSDSFSEILQLCKNNLETFKITRLAINRSKIDCLLSIFGKYVYPRLIEFEIPASEYNKNVLLDVYRNTRNLKNVICPGVRLEADDQDTVCTENWEILNLASCHLIGHLLPNLQRLELKDSEIHETTLMGACKLRILIVSQLRNCLGTFNFQSHESFNLRVLILKNQYQLADHDEEMDDYVVGKIAQYLPRLEILKLANVHVTNEGYKWLARMKNLHHLAVGRNRFEDLNDGMSRLGACNGLKIAQLDAKVSPSTLLALINYCPEIRYVCVQNVDYIGITEIGAVEFLTNFQNLTRRRKHDVKIRICYDNWSTLWRSAVVKKALKNMHAYDPRHTVEIGGMDLHGFRHGWSDFLNTDHCDIDEM